MPAKTTRYLSKRLERRLTVAGVYFGEKRVPTLRLTGNWLHEAGFEISHKVSVRISPGQILIQRIEEGSPCQ